MRNWGRKKFFISISLSLGIIGTLVGCNETNKLTIIENNVEDEALKEKFKIKNEYNFLVEDEEFDGYIVSSDNGLFLQNRDENYEISEKYEIVFEDGVAKKIKCDDLKDEKDNNYIKEFNEEDIINGYIFEEKEAGKGCFLDALSGEEFIVNLDKFNKDEMAKKSYGEYAHSEIYDNKLIFFISRDPGKFDFFSEDDSSYSEIRWYDFESEIWDKVKISKNQHLRSIVGSVDNTLYVTGSEEWGSQYSSKIYSIDLENKKIIEEKKIQNQDDVYNNWESVSEEIILAEVSDNEGKKLRTINLRNKVFYDLFEYDHSEEIWLDEILSLTKESIFLRKLYDGKGEVSIIKLKEGNLNGATKVYEYGKENAKLMEIGEESYKRGEPQILWSKDGKYLIIAEKKIGDKNIVNFKILEFNQ